jgi:anti-sigma regulatory factor (Ser/Thr protein kinase)
MVSSMSTEPEMRFPVRSDSVRAARQFVAAAVADIDVDRNVVAILTSEVATNAVLHANSDFRVRVQRRSEAVRIEIINDAPELLLIKLQPSTDGGRGLHILDKLAQNWGVETYADHKVVWFELGTRCDLPA